MAGPLGEMFDHGALYFVTLLYFTFFKLFCFAPRLWRYEHYCELESLISL